MAEDDKTEAEAPEAEANTEDSAGDAIGKKYREQYGKDGHNGDDIAIALKEFCLGTEGDIKGKVDPEKLAQVASDNGIDLAAYAHLNIGMQRMNVGNKLRGLHNKGESVKIGDIVIDGAVKEEKEAA